MSKNSALSVKTQLLVAAAISFFMLLTRGSHVLTSVALPDASLALFLLGGIYLGSQFISRLAWFAVFFILATVIDFGAAAFDPAQGFCLTNGYWGLIPAYGAMWLGGVWLAKQRDAFNVVPYTLVSLATTFLAFVISTQTYYLFSGRFPANGVIESMQHGWEYLPSWMGFSMMYFAIAWLTVLAFRNIKALQTSKV
ncbi:hypothetical protein [Methylotenera sp. N17]|uniref:hypothetical protein n=1 Tax=Methylotenera sp. N17 TaxID=1502761 RepID=UPI00064636D0|nr:hypothetical protein [Methylotenera sp. N17]